MEFRGPNLTPEQLKESLTRINTHDYSREGLEFDDQVLADYINELTPPATPALSRRLQDHPAAALLQNEKLQKLGLLRARIENVRAAILRDTSQNCSTLPALLVAAPVIAVPCTQLFAEGYYSDINEILLKASQLVSKRTVDELERIRLSLEAEYHKTLSTWKLSDEEWNTVEAIVHSRTDRNIRIRDRTEPTNPAFVIPPDVSKGHTLITPNPELRTLNKTTGRIPGPRRGNGYQGDQRGRRTSHGGHHTPASEAGSRHRESPAEHGRVDHQSPDLGFRRRSQQFRRQRN
jgi:hypothetical protein